MKRVSNFEAIFIRTCLSVTFSFFSYKKLKIQENIMLFCGVGVGYMNEKFPINSLRTDGHNITTERVKSHTGNKYAEYTLVQA